MGKSKTNLYYISKALIQKERIVEGLKQLNLTGIINSFEHLSEKSLSENSTPYDYLESLLESELITKEDARMTRWLKQAHFPFKKTLQDFDFTLPRKIDKRRVQELASCRFIERAENVIFLGPQGVGKTHLAVALGREAISRGLEVFFIELGELIDLVDKANDDALISRRLFASFVRPKLLVIDEIDLYDVTPTVSRFLIKLLKTRHEKSSVIFTSNRHYADWHDLFGNEVRAAMIIDRLVGRATVIEISGDSNRIRERWNIDSRSSVQAAKSS